MKKGYLVLNNKKVFEGTFIGAEKESVGELVFTTGMVGYLETLTDPSYAGQIIVQTFPLIGNYGVIESDFEGKCFANGYIINNYCDYPSNFRSEYELDKFLKKNSISALCGIDTRKLTRIVRKEGVMNAKICTSVPDTFDDINNYSVENAVKKVSTKENIFYKSDKSKFHVVVVDYGAKKNIIRNLLKRDCDVTLVPYDTSYEKILSLNPDGVMLSNGPGDPSENTVPIKNIKNLIGKIPIFGICLGHQLTALAMGGKTIKLKYGHRGVNQPVRDLYSERTYITSQNHGYAVVSDSVKDVASLSFINANDNSCEGLIYPDKKCFTVQFHPEACGGPHDTEFLFDRFILMLGGGNNAQG